MNIYTGLLFLDGHIADPRLAADLAVARSGWKSADGEVAGNDAPPSPRGGQRQNGRFPGSLRSQAMRLFHSLVFLGGRPMTAGHNYDIDEPFPQPEGDRAATGRSAGRAPARKGIGTERVSSRLPSCTQC